MAEYFCLQLNVGVFCLKWDVGIYLLNDMHDIIIVIFDAAALSMSCSLGKSDC